MRRSLPLALIGTFSISFRLSKAPSRRMWARGPAVSTKPDGATPFCLARASKICSGLGPRVARRS
ncbi:hypothetical protein D3C76_1759290 [compost metagenome]